eukprot:762004-Hanusia_phi.AAC.2
MVHPRNLDASTSGMQSEFNRAIQAAQNSLARVIQEELINPWERYDRRTASLGLWHHRMNTFCLHWTAVAAQKADGICYLAKHKRVRVI